jgi:hypothetical protein
VFGRGGVAITWRELIEKIEKLPEEVKDTPAYYCDSEWNNANEIKSILSLIGDEPIQMSKQVKDKKKESIAVLTVCIGMKTTIKIGLKTGMQNKEE